jgi:hypothetical protein
MSLFTATLADLRTSEFASAVALIECGYVIHPFPFAPNTGVFGTEPVDFRLGQDHPVDRWDYWARQALLAADAGCPVAVVLDNQGDVHLRFASDDAWQ